MTQLRVGDIVPYQGGLWTVILVNFCRAVIEREGRTSEPMSISANSDLPVVGRIEE